MAIYQSQSAYSAYRTIRNRIVKFSADSWICELVDRLYEAEAKTTEAVQQRQPWTLLLLLKWVLLNAEECSDEPVPHNEFARAYNDASALEILTLNTVEAGSHRLTKIFRRMAFQQFWYWQPAIYYEDIGRLVLLFKDLELDSKVKALSESAIGLPRPLFFELLASTVTRFLVDKEKFISPGWYQSILPFWPPGTLEKFFSLLSLSREEVRHYLMESINAFGRTRDDKWRYQVLDQTPLKDRPFFACADGRWHCYSPSVLGECLRWFYYDRLKQANAELFCTWFGGAMERYLEERLKEWNVPYTPERSLRQKGAKNSSVVDFLLSEGEQAVLVDSKAVEMEQLGRLVPTNEVFGSRLKTSVVKGVKQIYFTAHQIQSGKIRFRPVPKRFFGLVVTYKELYLGDGGALWEEFLGDEVRPFLIENNIPETAVSPEDIFFISLQDFDHLLAVSKKYNVSVANIVRGAVETNRSDRKLLFHDHLTKHGKIPKIPSLVKAFDDCFETTIKKMPDGEKTLAGRRRREDPELPNEAPT